MILKMILFLFFFLKDLGEFSNVENAPVRSRAYEGAVVECSQINYKPGKTKALYKDVNYLNYVIQT